MNHHLVQLLSTPQPGDLIPYIVLKLGIVGRNQEADNEILAGFLKNNGGYLDDSEEEEEEEEEEDQGEEEPTHPAMKATSGSFQSIPLPFERRKSNQNPAIRFQPTDIVPSANSIQNSFHLSATSDPSHQV
ncbi:hypothetical protein PGT21_024241 [Puccinia graminis f. sp. tritici]|uniref:Uncharacterized protein n=1 Tax=Puccinia graminis f. sp. tritici TaxID=56615 RepID=A0A5B0PLQ2_PUCGR|nr:hypothetical protein PGT21_024241 [Puccinia graminis f. sp. tritici]